MALSQHNSEFISKSKDNSTESIRFKLQKFLKSKIESLNYNKIYGELELLIKESILVVTSSMSNLDRLRFISKCKSRINEIEDYVLTSNLNQQNINNIDKNLRLLDITLMRVASYGKLPTNNIKK